MYLLTLRKISISSLLLLIDDIFENIRTSRLGGEMFFDFTDVVVEEGLKDEFLFFNDCFSASLRLSSIQNANIFKISLIFFTYIYSR
jgi:hypothetical protein